MNRNEFLMILGSVMLIASVISAVFVFIALDAVSGAPMVTIDGTAMNGITDKQLDNLMYPMVFLMVFVAICAVTLIAYGLKNRSR
jgi:hypothetical protein